MQILINAIQKKTMFSSERKIFRTKKAQMVMSGMLKPQIQVRLIPPPPPPVRLPFDNPVRLVPCIAFIRLGGTANDDVSAWRFSDTIPVDGIGQRHRRRRPAAALIPGGDPEWIAVATPDQLRRTAGVSPLMRKNIRTR